MLRKLTLALVTAASLGAIALTPTAASAGGGGFGGGFGGFHHHHHWGHGFGFGYIRAGLDDGCYETRRILTPFGYRLRVINVCEY